MALEGKIGLPGQGLPLSRMDIAFSTIVNNVNVSLNEVLLKIY
jgi:hypothetical protein